MNDKMGLLGNAQQVAVPKTESESETETSIEPDAPEKSGWWSFLWDSAPEPQTVPMSEEDQRGRQDTIVEVPAAEQGGAETETIESESGLSPKKSGWGLFSW